MQAKAKYIWEARHRALASTTSQHALSSVTRALLPDCLVQCWFLLALLALVPVGLIQTALDLDADRSFTDLGWTCAVALAPVVAYALCKCAAFHVLTFVHLWRHGPTADGFLLPPPHRWLYVWLGFAGPPSKRALWSYWRAPSRMLSLIVGVGVVLYVWEARGFWYFAAILSGALVWPAQLIVVLALAHHLRALLAQGHWRKVLLVMPFGCCLLGLVSFSWLNALHLIGDNSRLSNAMFLVGTVALALPLIWLFASRGHAMLWSLELSPWLAFAILLLLKLQDLPIRWLWVLLPAAVSIALHVPLWPGVCKMWGRVPQAALQRSGVRHVWSEAALAEDQVRQLRAFAQELKALRRVYPHIEPPWRRLRAGDGN